VTAQPALVLLHGAHDGPDSWGRVRAALPDTVPVLTPRLPVQDEADEPFTLERGAEAVAAALDAAGAASATLCGVGLGALVALQLAAEAPNGAQRLVLITRQVRLSPLLMSLPAVVLRLLPATAVQRLGAEQPQLLALLDQVRPVDAAPLAKRVRTPAVVLCGDRDSINRRASQTLAQTLPRGELRLLPDARPDWLVQHPELLSDVLRGLLDQPS
jgi:pimeloyl-ACP methyl ester carboxylesterase